MPDGLGDAVGRAATVLLETLVEHREERLLMGGTAEPDPQHRGPAARCAPCWKRFRKQVVVLKLLAAQGRQAGHRPDRA